MKKFILATLLGLTLISIGTTNTAFAKDTATETIVVSASEKSNSNKYKLYKKRNKKMVATGKTVKVNGKTWWKIGKNQYLKSTRVEVIDVAKNKELGIKISNYAN
jgi:hypothetical protein